MTEVRNPAPRVGVLAVAALLLLGALGAATAASQASEPQTPPRPLYWGAQIGDQISGEAAPWDMRPVYRIEHLVRKRMSLVSFSSPFAECSGSNCNFINFPTTPLENVRNHDAIPFFGWSSSATPEEANQQPYRLARIIDGSLDPYIVRFAESAREWGHPFFMRFDWEMNGFWFPWSEGVNGNRPGEFVAAWHHVHDIFSSVGATNVTWVWCPNVDFTHKLIPLRTVYPGDEYVDWTCLDGFNWGRRPDSAGWQTFGQVFQDTYHRVLRIVPHKPMAIGEVASNKLGGSKPRWIRHLLHIVPARYRRIRALIWFDVNDRNTHWPLEESRKVTNAFARGIGRPVYQQNVFDGLGTGPISPPSWP